MGPKQSQTGNIIPVNIQHSKFTNCKIVKINYENCIEINVKCDQKQFNGWQQKLHSQKEVKQHLFLPIQSTFSEANICGGIGAANLIFPHYPYTLSQQIEDRASRKARFQEKDLWYLLFSLVSARRQILGYGFKSVGDIRESNIFLNDSGKVKVSNLVSWPNQLKAFDKAAFNQNLHLAPQQFQRLIKGQAQNQSNTSAQVYSIGLTVLNAGLLISQDHSKQICNYRDKSFNLPEYYRRVSQWISSLDYSEILQATISNMVTEDVKQRLTQQQLWEYLSSHQNDIENGKDFLVLNAPNKIRQEIQKNRQLVKSKQNSLSPKQLQSSTIIKQNINQSNPGRKLFVPQSPIKFQKINNLPFVQSPIKIQAINKVPFTYSPSKTTYIQNSNYVKK